MAVPFRTAALMVFFVFPICAFAQVPTENPADEETAKVLAPITVTGSRIERIDIEGPMPVVVFDRAGFERAGINTLEEFARKLPLNWGPFGDTFGMSSGRDVGYADFDLRGIGTDSTLTLVNGRRIAPYPRYSGTAIDLNAIPVSAIERVEVLKDGASAIYGAEAIAGVVNIILRQDYSGLEISTGYGISEHGDAEEFLADFVTGRDDGRGSIMFALSWYDRDRVPSRDRDWAADADFRDVGGPRRGSSMGSPPSLLRYDTFSWEADPECPADGLVSWVAPFRGGTACMFNYKQYDGLITGTERIGATASGRYELRAGLSLFGDLLYSDRESENNQAPAPVQGSPLIETWTGLPYVPADHPGNPFGTDGEYRGRGLDLGTREYVSRAKASRLVLGLEGVLGNWDWLAAANYAENDLGMRGFNEVSQTRFQLALLGQGGPDGEGYYNPFGLEPENDPEVKDWLTSTFQGEHTSKSYGIELEFNGFFGALPGGPVGLASGVEFRKQELDQWYDEETQSGDLAGFGVLIPVSADRSVGSAYVEFSLPLHETLEAQLAARYDYYDDFGSTTNPKLALRWQPTPSLMLRGSYSTSFSPPSFTELFETEAVSVNWFLDSVRCDITGLPQDCDWWEYPYHRSGNPDLEPEEGASWFAGAIWEPSFVPGLGLQVDFWKFEHENRIIRPDPQTVLDEGGDTGIIREPTEPDGTPGRIIRVESRYLNFERLVTEGIDTTVRYDWRSDRAGDFHFSLIHTYTDRYEFTDTKSEWLEEGVNYAGKVLSYPIPKHRANFNASWSRGAHGVAADVQYVGDYENWETLWVDGERTDQPMFVSSYTTLDLQYSYAFDKLRGARLRIGCINCSGEEPPLTYYSEPEAYYDPRGRFYYIRWQQPIR